MKNHVKNPEIMLKNLEKTKRQEKTNSGRKSAIKHKHP